MKTVPILSFWIVLGIILACNTLTAVAADGSPYPCTGSSGVLSDPLGDAPSDDTDFDNFSWIISGNEITFTMDMPNMHQPLPVNRSGIDPGYKEYEWGVLIDVDADPYTGTPSTSLGEGADYLISISYFHSSNTLDSLFLDQMQWDLWEYSEASGIWSSVAEPELNAPHLDRGYQLISSVPGLSSQSKLMPFTLYGVPDAGFLEGDVYSDCRLENLDRIFADGFGS